MQGKGKLSDFVQKKRPAVGLLEIAPVGRFRSGEGPLRMAEELAFEHRGRDRGDVHGDEGPFRGRARPVNPPGGKLLAGSRFARDHDGIPAAGHDLRVGEQGPHPGGSGDDFRKGLRHFRMPVPGRSGHPDEQSPALVGPLDGQEKEIVVHRLDEVVVCAQANGPDRRGDVIDRGEDDELRVGAEGLRRFEHLKPVHFRHEQIEQNDVEIGFPNARDGFLSLVAGLHVPNAPPPQKSPDGTQGNVFVIDNEDFHILCLPSSRIDACRSAMLNGFLKRWSGRTAFRLPAFRASGSSE